MNLRYLFTFFVLCIALKAVSQTYTASTNPNTAPIICDLTDLDGFVGKMLDATSPEVMADFPHQPSTLCTSGGKPQNMSWFAFIAGSNTAKITISPFNCKSGKGIQAGMFNDPDFSDILINNVTPNDAEFIACDIKQHLTTPLVLESNKLVPGQTYYLYVDGWDADACEYRVNVDQSVTTQFFKLNELDNFSSIKGGFVGGSNGSTAKDTFITCPNFEFDLSVKGYKLDIKYNWKISPTTADYPYTAFTQLDSITMWKFKSPGTYTISMFASNGCDETDTISKTIVVKEFKDEDFGKLEVCDSSFPIDGSILPDLNGDGFKGWKGADIILPGKVTETIEPALGCKYDQTIDIVTKAPDSAKKVYAVSCDPIEFKGNILLNTTLDYNVMVPSIDPLKCDTILNLDAYILDVQGSIGAESCSGGNISVGFVQSSFSAPTGYVIKYVWKDKDSGVTLVDNDAIPTNILISKRTNVELTIHLSGTFQGINYNCSFPISAIVVDPAMQLPSIPVVQKWDLQVCEGVNTQNISVLPITGATKYIWTLSDAAKIIGNDKTAEISVDVQSITSSTTACVAVENTCGVSPKLCRKIEKVDKPKIVIDGLATICEDSIMALNVNAPNANYAYTWVLNKAVLVNGAATSSGPIQIKFNDGGKQDISIHALHKGCASDTIKKSIDVVKNVAQATLQTVSKANAIDVSWQTVPCAANYDIYVNGKKVHTTTTLSYTVPGLASGTAYDITIGVQGAGCACGYSTITTKVNTLACNEADVQITSPTPLVCEKDWKKTVSLTVNIKGGSATGKGQWQGLGVDAQGKFSPDKAKVGTNMIYYSYEDRGCTYKDSVEIQNVQDPKFSMGVKDPECKDESFGSLSVKPQISNAILNYLLDGKKQTGQEIPNIPVGNHTIEVVDANNCSVLESFVVRKPAYPQMSFDFNADPPFFDNQSLSISAIDANRELSLVDSMQWYINGKLFCHGNCNKVNLGELKEGNYTHRVIVYYKSCNLEEVFDMQVAPTSKLYISNVIMPTSNNNENKFLKVISNDDRLQVDELSIFSRWGEKIYSLIDFVPNATAQTWDGTINGSEALPGVYVVKLLYKNERGEAVLKIADITLLR
jgi:hypothetical protein